MASSQFTAINGNNPAQPQSSNVPPWAWAQLNQMAQQGYLYNVPPAVVAAVVGAENPNVTLPTAPNNLGYGLFGLSANAYSAPTLFNAQGQAQQVGPYTVTGPDLDTSTQAGFGYLAQVSAARIASISQGANPSPGTTNLYPAILTYESGWTGGAVAKLQSWGYPGASQGQVTWTPPSTFPTTYAGNGQPSGSVDPTGGVSTTGPNSSTLYTSSTGTSLGGTPTLMSNCYDYGLARNNGSKSCLYSPPGTKWCFTACEAKAYLAANMIFWGGILTLVGTVMLFSRGHGLLGKAAELAGAGITAIPGAELLGAGIMSYGHSLSQKSKSKGTTTHQLAQHIAKKPPKQKGTSGSSSPPPQRSGSLGASRSSAAIPRTTSMPPMPRAWPRDAHKAGKRTA